MAQIRIDISNDEVPEFLNDLRDLCEDYGVDYVLDSGEPGIIDLPPVDNSSFAEYVGQTFGIFVEEDNEPTAEVPFSELRPGDVISLPGTDTIYQVFSMDATGRVVLDELEECFNNINDCDGEA